MDDLLILKSLEQVKAIADVLRQRILTTLREKPLTTKQVAQQLKEPPTKLYHHVEILERAGLIQLVATKPNRGTVEKYYQAVAEDFMVDPKLFAGRPLAKDEIQALQGVFAGALEATLVELRQSFAAKLLEPVNKNERAHLEHLHLRASQAQIHKLRAKLQKLIKEFEASDSEAGEVTYGLTVVFYPVLPQAKKTKKKK